MGNFTSYPFSFSTDNEININLKNELEILDNNIQKIDKFVQLLDVKSDRVIETIDIIDNKVTYILGKTLKFDSACSYKGNARENLNFEPYSSYFGTSCIDIKSQWDD